ncbi:MAG: NADP oxidoreductase [Fibrobacter sp.]|nr:NADP oxidoreductase [Fibrobacter sp.]
MSKPKIATVFLGGCFGCHMTILDLDEKLETLTEVIEFNKSPLTDIKEFGERCKIGIIEGGCTNEDNVRVLQELRANCDYLISMGECAIQGDIPSLRNTVSLRECMEEAFLNGITVYNPQKRIPDDPELPLLLEKVVPCHQVVDIDYFIPGCSPNSEAVWKTINAILRDEPVELEYRLLKYD